MARATATDPRQRPTAAELRDALAAQRSALAPSPADELPADEQSWMRAVALTLAGATAIAL